MISNSVALAETTLTSDGPDANGLFTESAKLSITLTRKVLAATVECRIETAALETPSRHHLNIDLQGNECYHNQLTSNSLLKWVILVFLVRPKKVEVNGGRQHTVQGNKVALLCKVCMVKFISHEVQCICKLAKYFG